MTILVADVGGTNARLALAPGGRLDPATIRQYRNDDYGCFEDVIAACLASAQVGDIAACCVAMAGPVSGGRGVVTNRQWEISADSLRAATGAGRAMLLNDLTALGYAVGNLPDAGVSRICGEAGRANGQSLVIGVGTGFNVCPVIRANGAVTCLEAEAGHVSMPGDIAAMLGERLWAEARAFPTVEDCFSGRGLARLFGLMTGREGLSGGDIVAANRAGDAEAAEVLRLYSEMLGHLCRGLVLHTLPRNGVYFAGSVARGVFDAGFRGEFVAAFRQFEKFGEALSNVPISVIEDDCAALIGCIEAAGVG